MKNENDLFKVTSPQNALPLIFDSPHSGTHYPDDFNYACPLHELQKIEDSYVDDLFTEAPEHGATLLCALFPRSYIDVNRAIDDIDHTLIEGNWPTHIYGDITPTSRSNSGIGLIARLIKPGIPIYNRPLSADEIMNRVKTYYEPYHDTLCALLENACYAYGKFWHINCHSMPSSSAYPKRKPTLLGNMLKPSDIVLGDSDGRTCSRDFLYTLRDFWKNQGYQVTINDPFKGVELVNRYSCPTQDKNSIQIEINRALYMNEKTGAKNENYDAFKAHCTEMTQHCATFVRSNLTNIESDIAAD